MTRLAYALLSVALVQLGVVFSFFSNDQNVYNLLAAGVGALVARFFFPQLPIRLSVGGWLVGLCLAMIYGRSIYNAHLFHDAFTEEAVYASLAMAGDLAVQIVAWLVRLASKGGKYAEENPRQALHDTLDEVERVTTVWVRVKAPFLDLLEIAKSVFTKKQ